MNRMFDLYSDPAHAFLATIHDRFAGAQDFLKTAHAEDSVDELPNHAFADPYNRKFPVHTPEQATLSFFYAKYANASVPEHVMAEINTALDAYNIDPAKLEVLQQKTASSENPEDYLFNDPNSYPVRDEREVKLAEARLLEQSHKLSPERKVAVFSKLARAARLHGVKLANQSMAFAGHAKAEPERVLAAIAQRVFLKTAENAEIAAHQETLSELHKTISRRPYELNNPETQAKLASFLAVTDKIHGFTSKYGPDLLDPIDALYSVVKVAAADSVPLGPKYSVSASALAGVPATFFSDALGPDFAETVAPGGQLDMEQAQQVIGTLPADMLEGFVKRLRSIGVEVTE